MHVSNTQMVHSNLLCLTGELETGKNLFCGRVAVYTHTHTQDKSGLPGKYKVMDLSAQYSAKTAMATPSV